MVQVRFAKSFTTTWEFPKIGDPNIVPYIAITNTILGCPLYIYIERERALLRPLYYRPVALRSGLVGTSVLSSRTTSRVAEEMRSLGLKALQAVSGEGLGFRV